MPLVQAINSLDDGFEVVTTRGGTHTITSADIPANLAGKPLSQIEAAANIWLANRLGPLGMFGAVHLTSAIPLQGQLSISNDPLTGTWWAT